MPETLLSTFIKFLGLTWWFWAFFILLPLATSTWLFWRRERYKKAIKWVVLELRMPREVTTSPRGMEQVLALIHALRNIASDIREKWWDGEVTEWFSLEMASFGGEVRFFIRFSARKRDLVEAAFFSYYPDIEIIEVDDYIERIPPYIDEVYEQGYDIWGTEMFLKREAAYPTKTYLDFEAPEEEKQYDPMAAFLEVLGKAKREEIVGIQILITPAAPEWRDQFNALVEKLGNPKLSGSRGKVTVTTTTEFPGGPLPSLTPMKKEPGRDDMATLSKAFLRTPGETDVLKAVEDNLSRPAFDTLIRFIYLSPKAIYYDSYARRGLKGAFNQYGTLNMNSFDENRAMSTRTRFWNKPFIFPGTRNYYRKQRLLYLYRNRRNPIDTVMGRIFTSYLFNWNFNSKRFLMNTRCVATLFHPPTHGILTAPHVKRVESKKAGPPAGLAIFGDEREIQGYQ